jgi:hypothetical protein
MTKDEFPMATMVASFCGCAAFERVILSTRQASQPSEDGWRGS